MSPAAPILVSTHPTPGQRERPRPIAVSLLLGLALMAFPACQSQRAAVGARGPSQLSDREPSWREIGRSGEGRPIEAITIGHGPRRALIICGIHGNEPHGLAAAEPLREVARERSARWTTTIVRDLNPDGTHRGSRGNARGVDLNRNWPAENFTARAGRGGRRPHGEAPLTESETRTGFELIEHAPPDLCIVLHASPSGPFVNYDGPAAAIAEAFARAASTAGRSWSVRPSMGYPTHGSLGSYLGVDRGVAILTVEFELGTHRDRGSPLTKRAVAEAIAGVAAALNAFADGPADSSKR